MKIEMNQIKKMLRFVLDREIVRLAESGNWIAMNRRIDTAVKW